MPTRFLIGSTFLLRFVILLALATGVVSARTDFHVLRDSDRDGKADPCPTPAHAQQYSADTTCCYNGSTCTSTVDIDNDGTPERLYCSLQLALDAARAAGDSVEIHAGSWTEADSTLTNVTGVCNRAPGGGEVFMVVRPCTSGCSGAEGDRRYIRGALMGGAQDTPTITASASTVEAAMALGTSPSDSVRFVQIDHLHFYDAGNDLGCDDYFHGYVNYIGESSDAKILDNTFDGSRWDTAGECAAIPNSPNDADAMVGIKFVSPSTNKNAHRIEIGNNTFKMCGAFAGKPGYTCNSCQMDGWDVHDNSITVTAAGPDENVPMELQNTCNFVFRNNALTFANTTGGTSNVTGMKFRRGGGKHYFFNNYILNANRPFLTQEGSYEMHFFNNTINNNLNADGITNDSCTTCPAPNPYGAEACSNGTLNVTWDLQNNSVFNASGAYVIRLSGPRNGPGSRVGRDHWSGGAYLQAGSPVDLGHYVCVDSDACGSNSGYPECSGQGGCPASDPQRTRPFSGPPPWRLVTNSVLIGAGTSDPLGQGTGQCAITVWPGHVVDCSVDFDGNLRGSRWDIGADQYQGTGTDPAPSGVDNVRRDDTR